MYTLRKKKKTKKKKNKGGSLLCVWENAWHREDAQRRTVIAVCVCGCRCRTLSKDLLIFCGVSTPGTRHRCNVCHAGHLWRSNPAGTASVPNTVRSSEATSQNLSSRTSLKSRWLSSDFFAECRQRPARRPGLTSPWHVSGAT